MRQARGCERIWIGQRVANHVLCSNSEDVGGEEYEEDQVEES